MRRKHIPTTADLHRSWLELVDTDGPFLAVPPLKRVWPQGIPQPSPDALAALKDAKPAFEKAWENWDRNRDDASLDLYRRERDSWVETVLRDVLGWGDTYLVGPTGPEVRSPDHTITIRATGALVQGEVTGALVLVVDPVDFLRDPMGDGWATSPIDRMEELLRTAGVPIGVVTDGRWWAIASAREKTMLASGIVDAHDWVSQPEVRNAFIELLQRRRLLAGKPEDRLSELFGESVAAAEEITEALGTQVRRAVELLVQAMSEAALDAKRRGVPDPLPAKRADVYEAAVTVMMRVVFLLFAEERGLLPQSRLFTMGYGISDELDILDDRARDEGTEPLDATHLAWHRLLATGQALYQGASFEDLRLPAYGGSLFDPKRYSFLTKRTEQGPLAITVSDRVMLEVLRAVQIAHIKGQPARRISFRDIDVEQIGYIYEGLLGYSCEEAAETTVGLIGSPGEEPEIPLAVLESLAATTTTDTALADALLAWVKENQPAAKPPTKAALAKAIRTGDQVEDAENALRDLTKDEGLRERLRPFIGLIRRDLRNRPFVVQPGGMLVIETPSRASTGAHYTPRTLAEDVVRYALEPLVFEPGPHQTADQGQWRPVSSDRILDLKVADIACGSGAFLVAAARYLAKHLIEAWQREGVAYGSPHVLQTHAIRTVVATCLYGADINAMAVEMCKLSLWLVSLDPKLPFSFVDDKVLHGNSLLGLTDVRQLKLLHIDPDAANKQMSLFGINVDDVLAKATRLRRQLATEVNDADPQRSAATKRRQWNDYQKLVADLTDIANGVVAAGLRWGGKPGRQLREAYENLRIAVEQAYPGGPRDSGTLFAAGNEQPDYRMLHTIIEAGLTPTVQTDYERWKPLHWILAVPDVMERGGFDAIIGNPPFLGGQKLTGAMGTNIRDWFVSVLAYGAKGSADLVAYFFLRTASLLTSSGNIGLIATNTVAQNVTREVGLDQLVARGFFITRAIQSKKWPVSSASLQYSAVWGTWQRIPDNIPRNADGIDAKSISTLLEPAGRINDSPNRLSENLHRSFQGCIVLGSGFVLSKNEAKEWMHTNPETKDVLFPYLGGKDLNTWPDSHASRWIIDFNDRSEEDSKLYTLPYNRALTQVKEERAKNSRKVYRDYWWQFAEKRPAMRKAMRGLGKVIVLAQASSTQIPLLVDARQVFDQQLVVFTSDKHDLLAVLTSSAHRFWAMVWGSTRTGDPVYTPSGVFQTFPQPRPTKGLADIGRVLDTERREIMLRRDLGLTKLYNMVNDPDISDAADRDVARMREIHVALDQMVMDAYGWADLPLNHGFHTYRRMTRWTVSSAARVEILDRLLEENLRRVALQGEVPLPPEDEDEGVDDQ
ncbi:Eco57I restriction-modification methylase domain-containing protein [Nonomuraea rhodomycinica]|uniref:site-specific DNA-methyltransferase (adenine-specific) n=1 Tax=Nonomuraea rhodomycinica TaxID=1712872 RepID=A0A7Y6IRY0_9ACTN|nr:DNA methyltransferase [Nonomuraea rhodomycinica]NUW43304.1 SAM-dependent DNA methyltransferase [Nonomuraea rhodomycinica]